MLAVVNRRSATGIAVAPHTPWLLRPAPLVSLRRRYTSRAETGPLR